MPESRSARSAIPALFTVLLLAALFLLAIDQVQPPAPVPASAPATEFSSGRALEHLRVIAQAPHPTGSPENTRVREYLVSQLAALGLDPQVQTATVTRYERKWRGPTSAATVHNIVARLRGTAGGKALMLAAHYDSVPAGPGTSDDGSGTVTLIETARALKAGPPLRNDVIFLITDAEELGLLGAQAFVDDHPWAKDAGVVLNFEARGACGPVTMFETSVGNSWLIRAFAKAAPYPVASSFMYEAYKRLPNDTDLTVFKRAGLAGLNFAYVGCWTRYHTMRDDLANLSERSLQHDGSYAVALARQFGNMDLANTRRRDAVYFSLYGTTFHYSTAWVIPLGLAVVLAFIGVMALGFKRRELTARGVAAGFLAWLAATIVSAAGTYLGWLGLRRTRFANLLPYGMAYDSHLYAVAAIALTVAIFTALYAVLARKTAVGNLTVGALLWWAILALFTTLYVPGGSYLFVWPLAAATAELGCAFARRSPESEAAEALIWTLPAIVVILLFGPLPYLLLMLVSTSALPIVIVPVALLAGFLVPHLHVMTAHRSWWLPAAALAAALVFIVAGMATSGYDAAHPRSDSLFYALNADTGRAVWMTMDKSPDAWTSQFLSGKIERANLDVFLPQETPVLEAAAPVVGLPLPELTAMDDVTLGDDRLLRLHITSPRPGSSLWITFPGANVKEASVNGKKIGGASGDTEALKKGLLYSAVPGDGIILTVEVAATDALAVRVVDISRGLPEIPGASFKPRPDDFMPRQGSFIDSSTLVIKTFRNFVMQMNH
ncbi:MAG TPA: M20/M25/M40 family metallo-hydrolase [Terriglobia bacterium]|nr:M20/M25/M40 family metallo-hydrolase [Terriglobia bacterium]